MKKLVLLLLIFSVLAATGCHDVNAISKNGVKRLKAKRKTEWKNLLSPDAYQVMVNRATEAPYKNNYWNNKQKGVYVSAATGEVLFTTANQFDGGTGWPSFTQPADSDKLEIRMDNHQHALRFEVLEKSTGLHLGHVFNDGPAQRGGKRYSINSGALKFIKQQ